LLVELGHIPKSRPVRQSFDCEIIHARGAHFRPPRKSCLEQQASGVSRLHPSPSPNLSK
jgi:hypothetical protein